MKRTITLGAITAVNIGLVFLFQWYTLVFFGAGAETDALFAGMTIPQIIMLVVNSVLVHVLVPIFSSKSAQENLRQTIWTFIWIFGGGLCVLTAVLYVLAPYWAPLLFPGFDDKTISLTIELTQIQLIGLLPSIIVGIQWAAYHAKYRFIWAEIAPLLANSACLVLLYILLPEIGIVAAAWLSIARFLIQNIMMAKILGRPCFPNLGNKSIGTAIKRVRPLLFGNIYYKTDPIVDRYLLSTQANGSLTLFYFGQQIYAAVNQVINKAICAPLVPTLSKYFEDEKSEAFLSLYYRKLKEVTVVCSLGFVVFVVFGEMLLSLLAGYGEVSSDNIETLWSLMVMLGGFFIGATGGQFAASVFYSCGDTKTPTKISIVTYTIYIPTKVLAFTVYGIAGLAIVTSLYYMTNFVLQLYFLEKGIIGDCRQKRYS